jgi:hypothetical protein
MGVRLRGGWKEVSKSGIIRAGGDAMSRTVTVSDEVYGRLEVEARRRGLSEIPALLEVLLLPPGEFERRQELGRRIEAFQNRMAAKYGVMPDSAELIREDRDR